MSTLRRIWQPVADDYAVGVVDLNTPLSFSSSFRFPLQSALARREVLIGAALLVLLPGWGWLLNMGHRIAYVRNMQDGRPPFPAWTGWRQLTWDGLVTFAGMVWYHAPASACIAAGTLLESTPLLALGALLWCAATAVVPGYMTHYCKHGDALAIFNPALAVLAVVGHVPAVSYTHLRAHET